jgi:DNA-binding response OmpR family regulator
MLCGADARTRMRILLVEDDLLIAKSLAQALMSQHYAVDIAADGQEGWEAATLANYKTERV